MMSLDTKINESFKSCVVKSCSNTTLDQQKIFFGVPAKHEIRLNWSHVLQCELKGNARCCQDHFNLEEDTENWMRYKLVGNVKLRLKKDALPHIFNAKDTKKKTKSKAVINFERKLLVQAAFAAAEAKDRQLKELNNCRIVKPQSLENIEKVMYGTCYRSKAIRCDLDVSSCKPRRTKLSIMTVDDSDYDEQEQAYGKKDFNCTSREKNIVKDVGIQTTIKAFSRHRY